MRSAGLLLHRLYRLGMRSVELATKPAVCPVAASPSGRRPNGAIVSLTRRVGPACREAHEERPGAGLGRWVDGGRDREPGLGRLAWVSSVPPGNPVPRLQPLVVPGTLGIDGAAALSGRRVSGTSRTAPGGVRMVRQGLLDTTPPPV
jgi:hypothetical protein